MARTITPDEDDFEDFDDRDMVEECNFCGGTDGDHHYQCPDATDPYAMLLKDGYD